MKRIKITTIISTYRIIKIVDYWGKKTGKEQYGKGIEIRNRNKEFFDWENKQLEGYSGLVEEEGRNHHRELALYIPGVDTEKMITEKWAAENELSDAQRVASAARNANITT